MDKQRWQRAKDIFDQTGDLDSESRVHFIEAQAGDDSALKELVLDMWRAEEDHSFMPELPAVNIQESNQIPQGQVIGEYLIIKKIAVGGMGRIYQAQKVTADVPVFVALKLIRKELVDAPMMQRFENEKNLLSKLQHPHIAALMDAGVLEEGPFLATEWVNGQPINQHVLSCGLGIDQILALFLQVCQAVAYAHNQLIIHRDLKPANILVDRNAQVKLLDFGIAKLIDVDACSKTQTQVFTPDYAAPEQINGEPCTTATDVYALGMLLFELLVGERRFGNVNQSMAERINEIAQPKTVYASQWMMERNKTGAQRVKGALDNIINKAMHPDPQRRYHSVHALVEDVHNYRHHFPVKALGDGWWYRSQMFLRRHAWPSALAALLLVSLLVGLVHSNHQTRLAQAAEKQAQAEATKSQQMLNFFTTMMHTASPITGGSTQITVQEMFEKSSENFDLDSISDPELKADIANQIADVYGDLSAQDLKIKYHQEALKYYATDVAKYPSEFLSNQLSIAIAYRNQNQYEAALAHLQQAYDEVKGFTLDPGLEAQTLVNFAEIHRSFDRNDEALGYLLAAEKIAQPLDDAINMGKVRYYQYLILQYRLPPAESEQYLSQAMDYFERGYEYTHPNLLAVKNSMAIKLKVEGRYREAVDIYTQLHQENIDLYGNRNHNQLINHADAKYYLGDFQATVDLINQAIQVIETNQVGEGFSKMAARIIKARALLEMQQIERAEPLLETAIEYFKEKLPAGHALIYTLDTYWLDFLMKSGRDADVNMDVAALVDGVVALKNESNDSKRRHINTQMIAATYYWVTHQPPLALNHFMAAHVTISGITVKQEWNYWFITASIEQLKKQMGQAHNQARLAQALSQLFVLLPENHWYHKLFQDVD